MADRPARQAQGSGAEAYARSRQYDYRAVSCSHLRTQPSNAFYYGCSGSFCMQYLSAGCRYAMHWILGVCRWTPLTICVWQLSFHSAAKETGSDFCRTL